jgi:hypothetical protein
MTKIDWAKDKRRHQVQQLRRDAAYDQTRRSWQEVADREQRMFARFAREHRHEHPYCLSVAQDLDAGRRVSRRQAATLRQIAHERRWKVGPMPGPRSEGKRRREQSDPQVRTKLHGARRAVETYEGTDGWLLYLQRTFVPDPAWLPTEKEASAILRRLGTGR